MLNDTAQEGNETFTVTLSAPTNASLSATPATTFTILDDDQPVSSSDEYYNYDAIGNFTTKANKAYAYTASVTCAAGTRTIKHAPSQAGSVTMAYDCNGNMTTDGTRTLAWDAENRPSSVVVGSATETYTYNADNERVRTVRAVTGNPTATTIYLEGVWEETTVGGVTTTKTYYGFGGQMVALRQNNAPATYLHGDHLGSVSVTTDKDGNKLGEQRFDPWGEVRPGATVTQTSLNYTGQRRDETGLLYYNARYYNPVLGRFISPDTVVPGNASGGMDGIQLRPLTVDFHEPDFVSQLAQENKFAPWLQLSEEDQGNVGTPWGPENPQALNRYSYVQNNPMRWTDPTGHYFPCKTKGCRGHCVNISGWSNTAKRVTKFFCFFLGCTVDEKEQKLQGPSEADSLLGSIPLGNVRFGSGKLLTEHFKDHKAEFGYKSVSEYLAGARNLIAGGDNVLSFRRNNGDVLFYNHIENEFAVVNRYGNLTTYFKPVEGMEYWLEQLRKP